MLYAFFWVIPRRLNFICRRFGTLCLFHLHRWVSKKYDWIEKSWTIYRGKGKGKAVPLQAQSGPEGSRKLRFPDFVTTAQDGGKVVSLTHRPPLPPRNTHGTFQYLKKARFNEQLYKKHLECAAAWPRIWTSIQQIIDSNLQGVVVQPTLRYHITNSQSRYITPTRLKSAYTTQQVLASS